MSLLLGLQTFGQRVGYSKFATSPACPPPAPKSLLEDLFQWVFPVKATSASWMSRPHVIMCAHGRLVFFQSHYPLSGVQKLHLRGIFSPLCGGKAGEATEAYYRPLSSISSAWFLWSLRKSTVTGNSPLFGVSGLLLAAVPWQLPAVSLPPKGSRGC